MYTNKQDKITIINKFKINHTDIGSTPIQVALLTLRINNLHKHFQNHKKDHHSRRGLLNLISQRRKLLNYFKKKNFLKYNTLLEQLNLRK
ncbi:30S ribosomal protein S15 [Enterobacteriaceae endosymbiont of Macroplea appendiculata]|uniref:30S ribosomal protein S15 n=1 Tax=Enterobacteriaceae endosymbiont of Macroplea appendiculata TaxID=2675790 RepID=UPI001449CBB6|nr:30S ribosomal protein S15 [Enterobacteriaceae endosymbiont of Macroplea appendiculata]QJC30912.1 30S ribosomal protein S15 [Enterobacteriaceae endosymbiont of Macroplea appendiculata]